MEREYYPKSLGAAIGDYEKGNIPSLLKARQVLAKEVVELFNRGDAQNQQKAVEGLLEAIELRMLVDRTDIRAEFEERLTQIDRAT